MTTPVPDSYWVVPGRLIAGEYPGARDPDDARRKLARFEACGITSFVDLTQDGELEPYAPLLPAGARVRRLAIRDGGCPTREQMRETLDLIDTELREGRVVYVHCWGGHGRTGTVVGCWLVRHGSTPDDALARVTALRAAMPDAHMPAPETDEQIELVRSWREGQ